MRVLGIDPGLRNTGWGVITVDGPRLRHVANGVIQTKADGSSADLAQRLSQLYRGLCAVIAAHAPDLAAVEQTFVNKDAVGTLKLGQARGAAISAVVNKASWAVASAVTSTRMPSTAREATPTAARTGYGLAKKRW